jgi:hypothetical protein
MTASTAPRRSLVPLICAGLAALAVAPVVVAQNAPALKLPCIRTPLGYMPPGCDKQAAATPPPVADIADLAGVLQTRPPAGIDALFARKNVNGEELIVELTALRSLLRAQRSAQAVGSLLGELESSPAAMGGLGGIAGPAVKLAVDELYRKLKDSTVSIAFEQLDRHLEAIIGDKDALRRESVQLPDATGLDARQRQRAVVMAALLVGSRVTNKMLKQARNDFANIEKGYANLLDRREKAAGVLYELVLRGAAGRERLATALSPADLAYLDRLGQGMKVGDFAKDMGAQNVALAYLAKADPEAYAGYKAQSDKLLPATRGYLRAVSGSAAFGAMLTTFARETLAALRGKSGAEMMAVLPLAFQFVQETPSLMEVALDTAAEGVTLPFKPTKRFRVADAKSSAELSTAKEAFAEINKRQAEPVLRGALFRNGAPGLLQQLHSCSPGEAGRLIDTAVPQDQRDAFAREFLGDKVAPGFSFGDFFERAPEQASPRERELMSKLLVADYSERVPEGLQPLSALQGRITGDGFRRWSDDQLTRLVLVNRESLQVRDATLELGEVTLRPVASAQTVMAYETLIDACRSQLQREPGPRR